MSTPARACGLNQRFDTAVWVPDEADARSAFRELVRRPFRLDAVTVLERHEFDVADAARFAGVAKAPATERRQTGWERGDAPQPADRHGTPGKEGGPGSRSYCSDTTPAATKCKATDGHLAEPTKLSSANLPGPMCWTLGETTRPILSDAARRSINVPSTAPSIPCAIRRRSFNRDGGRNGTPNDCRLRHQRQRD
jgi:hypothetical protein